MASEFCPEDASSAADLRSQPGSHDNASDVRGSTDALRLAALHPYRRKEDGILYDSSRSISCLSYQTWACAPQSLRGDRRTLDRSNLRPRCNRDRTVPSEQFIVS